jgi:hypothetical protein
MLTFYRPFCTLIVRCTVCVIHCMQIQVRLKVGMQCNPTASIASTSAYKVAVRFLTNQSIPPPVTCSFKRLSPSLSTPRIGPLCTLLELCSVPAPNRNVSYHRPKFQGYFQASSPKTCLMSRNYHENRRTIGPPQWSCHRLSGTKDAE